MADEAKLHRSIHSNLKHWFVQSTVRHCHGKLGPFCWPVPMADVAVFSPSHQFAEHTFQVKWFRWDSESYSRSDQQQTTRQWPWSFFSGASLALGSVLELYLGPATELVIAGCRIKCTFHCTSNPIEKWFVVAYKRRQHFRMKIFFDCSQLMRNPLIELLGKSLLQMPNSCRMVDIEFLGNFSCSWKRIRFDDFLSWSL